RVGRSPRRSPSTAEAGSTFSFSVRRVTGAWWPSRSSKPLSVRKSRGRFDSCPLRQRIFDFRLAIFDFPEHATRRSFNRNSKFEIRNFSKGGEQVCRASKFASSLRFRPALGERPS